MKAINKIIFNTLASRKGINLPRVGSLTIVTEPAELVSKKKLMVPAKKVIFSQAEDSSLVSVVSEIERIGGVSHDEAVALYEKWLDDSMSEKGLVIDGVGRIKSHFFTPAKELSDILNPIGETSLGMITRQSTLSVVLIVIAGILVVTAGVLGYYWWKLRPEAQDKAKTEVVDTREKPQPLREESLPQNSDSEVEPGAYQSGKTAEKTTGPKIIDTGIPPVGSTTTKAAKKTGQQLSAEQAAKSEADRKAMEAAKKADAERKAELTAKAESNRKAELAAKAEADRKAASAKKAETAKTQQQKGVLSRNRYYVVMGVFSIASNADKCIRELPKDRKDLTPEKFVLPSGRVMVTIFSSTSEAEARRFHDKYKYLNSEMWVYRPKK